MNDDQVLRCPFCPAKSVRVIEIDVDGWVVTCGACGSIGPTARDAQEAIRRWNVPLNLVAQHALTTSAVEVKRGVSTAHEIQ